MTDQDKQNIEVVKQAYQDEAGKKAISPNIVWHVPGHNPVSGVYRGVKAYREEMVQRMGPIEEWIVDVDDVMINGDLAVAAVHIRGKRKGHRVELDGAHVLRVQNGQVVEGWGFVDRQDVLDEFFST
jgi:ketosteroid isomerase-like protein